MNKTKIVCDTNIWYGFANRSYDSSRTKGQNLIATYVSIAELAQTPNMTENPELFIKTLSALKKNYKGIIKSNPYEYLIEAFFYDFKPDQSMANRILNGFDAFMTIDTNSIPIEVLNKTRIDIKNVMDLRKSISEPINTGLITIRQYIKKNGGKKRRKKARTISSWKRFVSDIVLSYSREFLDKEYKIDINHPNWHFFEFLILTFEEYFLKLEISGNGKFDNNDWGDLLNLVYVQPHDQYWTEENKWNNIFRQNETLSKYIYKKNAT